MDLKGKKVLITGGSSGLGLALVHAFSDKDSEVLTCARDLENLNKEVKETKNVKTYQCDVSDSKSVQELIKEVGLIDVLINNAGVHFDGNLKDMQHDQIDKVINVNLKGLIYVTNEVVKNQKNRETYIVNISSTTGLKARPQSSVYCASKWGVTGFTDSLKEELAGTNFHIFGFYPGGMQTNLFKGDRDTSTYMNPEEVAKEIVHILERSEKVNVDHIVVNRP